jgi:hypothetical protein
MSGSPTILVQNMPGAASIGPPTTCPRRSQGWHAVRVGLAQSSEPGSDRADALKVDRANSDGRKLGTNTVVCYVRGGSAIRKANDLFTRDLIVAASGQDRPSTVPTALNRLLNMRFKIVEG